MKEESLCDWLKLFALPELTAGLYTRLIQRLGSPAAILEADPDRLRALGMKVPIFRSLKYVVNRPEVLRAVDIALQWLRQPDHHLIAFTDTEYPPLLKQIPDPPPLLFVRGCPQALLVPQMAVVGSRRCSIDGRETAAMLSADLARRGLSICSGLASGIDSVAHNAALSVDGTTVAVLGTGADIIYPTSNLRMADRICGSGALISELPLQKTARPDHFPRRNRIISGMSLGVIVVEAALKSGSLITARLAMEQNREVFAVPGSIRNPLSRGCHRLIRDGVTLLENPEQVVEQIGPLVESHLLAVADSGRGADRSSERDAEWDKKFNTQLELPTLVSMEERAVMRAMGYDPAPMDLLVERTGLAVRTLHEALLSLEMSGLIRCDAGRYVRC